MVDIRNLIFVGIGGFFGANLRYIVSILLPRVLRGNGGANYATLFANLTGSFLLAAFLTAIAGKSRLPNSVTLMIGTGFFGSYTTFSTFANETVSLARAGGWSAAIAYWGLTNITCLAGVLLGIWVGHKF